MTTSGMLLPDALTLTHLALIVAGAVIGYLWWWARECRCEKCAFHVNEARVARLRHAELKHDTAHKGFGFKDGAKDYLPCDDDTCPRNPKRLE